MKDKTLFGMLNDDYREFVLKENEMKKVRAEIREKSKLRKLNESVNVNVTPDGNININVEENKEPVEKIEEPIEVATEEVIEEGCDKKESCEKKEAEAIVKNPTERGEIEFNSYENILKEVAKELLKDLNPENVEITMDSEGMLNGTGFTGIEVKITPTVEGDYGIKYPVRFDLGVSDKQFGEPGGIQHPEGERFLQFYGSEYFDEGSGPCIEKKFNAKETPISELKSLFINSLKDNKDVKSIIKQAKDLDDVIQYRADNNITDSEKLKESETEEEIGEEVITSVISKIAAEDEELANKVKEILNKDSEEVEEEVTEEVIEEEPFEECEISSYKVTRIAPRANAYMLEAQTKDGLKYIIGKNFNEVEKTLDEAEVLDNKIEASNKFRSLLK